MVEASSERFVKIDASSNDQFSQIQKLYISNEIDLHTFILLDKRSLNMLKRKIPTDIAVDEGKMYLKVLISILKR